MATSTSYRRTTTLSTDLDNDAALQSKLEQARRQRTAFYRRLAETGARAQADDDGGNAGAVEVEVDGETSTRRRRRLDMTSPHFDVVTSTSATQSALTEPLPEPRSRLVVIRYRVWCSAYGDKCGVRRFTYCTACHRSLKCAVCAST